MNSPRSLNDVGQAFPIYITVVAGLLFLAFAYLAVGQAATTRNGAQTAADAAALAAAQETRDQLAGEWAENVEDPASWDAIFDGVVTGLDNSCWRADQLAAQNGAHVEGCAMDGPLRYSVEVKTDEPVGDSIVPGTEDAYAHASAVAVIEPNCMFESPEREAEDDPLPTLTCKDQSWNLGLDDLPELPEPQDLFDVHLTD
ncbi:pilus assembly protein TadG-related protein [Streptomyces sp. NPDC058848]|uniref:pilus assembly protein TadG-related protein n=1 Tax=unclassified Streptomyces TaxID=2593676 RepID=UPI003694EA3C